VLGAVLFSGDDVEKQVGVLSGGERARVALAKLLLVPSNFLLMDEPTNHLDLDSSERLIEALRRYEGTLLFVSHNRSFVNQLATEVWDVGPAGVVRYPGNLDEYLQRQSRETSSANANARVEKAVQPKADRERRREEAEARQRHANVEGPIRKEIATVEKQIASLEQEQQDAELQMANPDVTADFARLKPLTDAHRERAEALQKLYQQWERAEAKLASLSDQPEA
jgi:ATP-binding cassette subfamily F protein 3